MGKTKEEILDAVINAMTEQERKNWIYQHVDNAMIKHIIANMTDEEIDKELKKVK